MADQQPSFFDTFAGREAERMETIMAELDGVPWAQGILRSVQQNGGLVGKNMANFFELRYGHALHKAGIAWSTKCREPLTDHQPMDRHLWRH